MPRDIEPRLPRLRQRLHRLSQSVDSGEPPALLEFGRPPLRRFRPGFARLRSRGFFVVVHRADLMQWVMQMAPEGQREGPVRGEASVSVPAGAGFPAPSIRGVVDDDVPVGDGHR